LTEEQPIQPWTIEGNAAGFLYVVDHDGNKVCTVLGDYDTRMARALAISELPILVARWADHTRQIPDEIKN